MIILKDNSYQTHSLCPNIDWTGEAKYVVPDGTPLANKIIENFPYYDFVLDTEGKLIDVKATSIPAPTAEELDEKCDTLCKEYIHDKKVGYSLDDENKIMREYLSDMNNITYKAAFEAYNVYVEECKQKAYKEIYG